MKRSEMNHELIAQQHCGSIMAAVKNGLSADFLIRIVDGQVAASKAANMRRHNRVGGRPQLSYNNKPGMTLDFTDEAQLKLLWTIINMWPVDDAQKQLFAVPSMELVKILKENGYPNMSPQSLAKLLRDNSIVVKASSEKQLGINPKWKPKSYLWEDFKYVTFLIFTDPAWSELNKAYQAEHPEVVFRDGVIKNGA